MMLCWRQKSQKLLVRPVPLKIQLCHLWYQPLTLPLTSSKMTYILESVVSRLDNLTTRPNRTPSRDRNRPSYDRADSPHTKQFNRRDNRRHPLPNSERSDCRPETFRSRQYDTRQDTRRNFDQSPHRPAQSPVRYNSDKITRGRYDRNVQNQPIRYQCSRPGHFARNCTDTQERSQPISNQQRVRFARLPPNA